MLYEVVCRGGVVKHLQSEDLASLKCRCGGSFVDVGEERAMYGKIVTRILECQACGGYLGAKEVGEQFGIGKAGQMSDVRVTEEHVKSIIEKSEIHDVKMGSKTTVVQVTLPNGFVIVQSSSCVDPANYDHELGKKLCMKRVEDKIWELEGYALQKDLHSRP